MALICLNCCTTPAWPTASGRKGSPRLPCPEGFGRPLNVLFSCSFLVTLVLAADSAKIDGPNLTVGAEVEGAGANVALGGPNARSQFFKSGAGGGPHDFKAPENSGGWSPAENVENVEPGADNLKEEEVSDICTCHELFSCLQSWSIAAINRLAAACVPRNETTHTLCTMGNRSMILTGSVAWRITISHGEALILKIRETDIHSEHPTTLPKWTANNTLKVPGLTDRNLPQPQR